MLREIAHVNGIAIDLYPSPQRATLVWIYMVRHGYGCRRGPLLGLTLLLLPLLSFRSPAAVAAAAEKS